MKINEEKSKMSFEKYVEITHNDYGDQDARYGTSHLKTRKLYYLSEEPRDEEIITTHHRWNYRFKDTWEFLKYSMLPDGRMLRPAIDMIDSLLNPENPILSISDHMIRLKMLI